MARTADEVPIRQTWEDIIVLLFCECMRRGEEGSSSRRVTWRTGEYDVLSTEEVYVAVAGHRAVCALQPDLLAPASAELGEAGPQRVALRVEPQRGEG